MVLVLVLVLVLMGNIRTILGGRFQTRSFQQCVQYPRCLRRFHVRYQVISIDFSVFQNGGGMFMSRKAVDTIL